jgi:hypothetical protein
VKIIKGTLKSIIFHKVGFLRHVRAKTLRKYSVFTISNAGCKLSSTVPVTLKYCQVPAKSWECQTMNSSGTVKLLH